MKRRQRRKCIAWEVRLLYRISTGAALFMAAAYMLSFVYRENIHSGKDLSAFGSAADVLCTFSKGRVRMVNVPEHREELTEKD